MIASINSSASVLEAYSTKMGATAHNVANVNTEDFNKTQVTFSEDAQSSVKAVVSTSAESGGGSGGVDLAEEFSGMIGTQAGYDANLKTIQTQNEMTGRLINQIA